MHVGFTLGIVGAIAAFAGSVEAGTVAGRFELPAPPDRGPVAAKGFLERSENPLAEIKKLNIAPYFVVALENDARPGQSSAQVSWDLVGESFARPVIAVPAGAEVAIKNQTKVARTISVAEDPKLLVGPLNPGGTKSFRVPTTPAIFTLGDKDAPYLRGKVVVVTTTHVTMLDDGGRFELTGIPDGNYKLRVYYYGPGSPGGPGGELAGHKTDALVFTTDVVVATRGRSNRTEINARLPALAAAGKK